jgi:membrane fusion protein, multidrug efflux system
MYAYFNVKEPTILEIRRLVREGVIKSKSIDEIEVRMGLADDVKQEFPLRGTLDFINNTVNRETGAALVRGVFKNPSSRKKPPLLMPGYSVRVRLDKGLPHKTLLVAERAIGADHGNKYVYVVDNKNKVVYRRVRLGMLFHGLRAIEEGLKPGERVVVNDLQHVQPGVEVKPQEVKMSDYVIQDVSGWRHARRADQS